MVRKKEEMITGSRCIRNGIGDTMFCQILNDAEEMNGKGRMFNHMMLPPGHSIGSHTHTEDCEIFYFLSGSGEYDDNGTVVPVKPGDTAICGNGEAHALVNNTEEPLEFIALILYK